MHSSRGSKRLLIVEDEALIRRVVAALLEGQAVVRAVATAAEALVMLATESFDVVLCDHHLGSGMTGSELLDEIAVRWPDMRRYLISASELPSVHPVLRKPFDYAALKRALE